MGRVFEFLDEEEMEDESQKHANWKCQKVMLPLSMFALVIHQIRLLSMTLQLKLSQEQKVAIVGPTGAGKTTMVNLLMRFYDIQAGKIAIDGVDTKSISREEVHDAFSMVLQDTWLFEGTIQGKSCLQSNRYFR